MAVRIDSNKYESSEQSISEHEDDDGHTRKRIDAKVVMWLIEKKSFAGNIKKR